MPLYMYKVSTGYFVNLTIAYKVKNQTSKYQTNKKVKECLNIFFLRL